MISALFLSSSILSAPLRIAVSHDPPYRMIEGDSKNGIYIEMAKKLAEKMGLEIQWIPVSLKRGLILMRSGEADLMLGPNLTPEREQFMIFLKKAPLPGEYKAFYAKDPENRIERYDQLLTRKVAVVTGANYFEPFNTDPRIDKEFHSNYLQCLKKVYYRRVHVALIPERLGDYLILQHQWSLEKSSYKIPGSPSYFALSKKSPLAERAEEMERVLKSMNLKNYFSEAFIKNLAQGGKKP